MKYKLDIFEHIHAWRTFVNLCDFTDVGPIKDQVQAALVSHNGRFSTLDRSIYFETEADALLFVMRFS